ncbi:MAG: T9SS type A sorting domain-containing protein [Bacteroidia bacterium]
MKNKLILSILCLYTLFAKSQSTLYQYYSYNFNSGYEKINPLLLGQNLFFTYLDMSISPSGPCIQKNDLDGNIIWKKVYAGMGNIQQYQAYNGNLIIAGETTSTSNSVTISNICIASVDTSNGTLNYFKSYVVPNCNMLTLSSSKILSNGDLLLGGNTFTNGPSTNCCRGYLGRFDPSNGNMIGQHFMQVLGENCTVKSIEQFNNSTLYLSGSYSVNNSYVAKLDNVVNPNAPVVKSINAQAHKVSKIGGNTLLLHKGGVMLKVDSSLNALPVNSSWRTYSFGSESFYENGKIYVMGGPKQLAIIDTAGSMNTTLSSYKYNVAGGGIFGDPYMVKNNSNLFIAYNYNQTAGPFSLLKTDLNGNMSCAVTETTAPTTFSLMMTTNACSVIPNTGSLTAITATVLNGLISNTTSCLVATDIKGNSFDDVGITVNYLKDGYNVRSKELISDLYVYDLSGREIQHFELSTSNYSFSLAEKPSGLYILSVKTIDGRLYRDKILK